MSNKNIILIIFQLLNDVCARSSVCVCVCTVRVRLYNYHCKKKVSFWLSLWWLDFNNNLPVRTESLRILNDKDGSEWFHLVEVHWLYITLSMNFFFRGMQELDEKNQNQDATNY